MNAIIFSAGWGIVMMFCSFLVKNKTLFRHIASAGLFLLLVVNIMETNGVSLFNVDTKGMLEYSRFGLFFNSIVFGSTLIYVLLTGRDIERVGNYVAEYFILIFFVLCGISVLSSYNNLLMLFLGIEIMSIPLYILTGSDKRNLKSNEASLKYFLMGAFSTG
jgi:NADH-quinone oxidoreductase subunit N